MRIALVITELYPGGAEKCLVNLARFLHQQGHEVCVWQLWPTPPPERRQLVDLLAEQGISFRSCETRKPAEFLRGVKRLRHELAEFDADIVQAFLFHANLACALAARTSFFSKKKSFRSLLFGGVRVRQPQRWRGRAQRFASDRMTKLICVSREVAEHCIAKERIPSEKIEVIPNGIRLDDLPPPALGWDRWNIRSSASVVLYVGRLDEQKQVLQFLRHCPTWMQKAPDTHLVLMGDGPQRKEAEQLAQEMQNEVGTRIHFAGWQEAPLAWMQAASVVVLPAAYEGMPNVILEAMVVGKPVITFAVDGIEQLLGQAPPAEEQSITPNDFQAFGNAIVKIIASPDLQNELGSHNAIRIKEEFQLEQMLKRYESLYFDALKSSS